MSDTYEEEINRIDAIDTIANCLRDSAIELCVFVSEGLCAACTYYVFDFYKGKKDLATVRKIFNLPLRKLDKIFLSLPKESEAYLNYVQLFEYVDRATVESTLCLLRNDTYTNSVYNSFLENEENTNLEELCNPSYMEKYKFDFFTVRAQRGR